MGRFDHQRENKFIRSIDLNYIKERCMQKFGDSYIKESEYPACLHIADITIHKLYNVVMLSNHRNPSGFHNKINWLLKTSQIFRKN